MVSTLAAKHGFHHPDLVGGIPTPLKNMSSSVGMMKFPMYGKRTNVPNHQPNNDYQDLH